MNIENLGKGGLVQPEDPRDYSFEIATFGAAPIDWGKEFRLPEPPDENQQNSDACVAYATSYLHWQLKGKPYSRRDVFSRIALSYGAYLRDGVKQICTTGQQTRDECPDPQNPNGQNMRVKSDKPDSAGMDDLEANYFLIQDGSIDGIATAIRDYKGCIFGVHGTNQGWSDLTNPIPPNSHSEPGIWQHAIYAFGYHFHDGQKCIIAKSSWCNPSHNEHHIKENYFIKGMTFNGWAVIPKESTTMQLVNDKGTVYIVTGNQDKRKIGIADQETLGLFGDEPQVQMDTSNIPEYQTISKGFVIHNK